MRKTVILTWGIAAAIMFFSCSTTKKKEDVKGFKKLFHNTTAKFNGYFNAEELMDDNMLVLQGMHVDNYNKLLSVYDYIDVDNPQAVKEDMDKAIEKVSTVATVHEVSNYVDDCYLIIGKAQFLKQDYIAAEETFQYFEEVFDPKNPYGRAYDSKAKSSRSGRNSKKEVKAQRKEKEQERKEEDKIREEERKQKEKEKEEERKRKEQEKEDLRKAREKEKSDRKKESKSRTSRSSKGKSSRGSRSRDKEEEKAPEQTTVTPDEQGSNVGPILTKEEQKALDEAKEELDSQNKEEERRREKLEKEKEEQKKKEEEKYRNQGEGAIFKNRSAYTLGLYWLGRTYIETERFSSAEFVFRQLEDTPGLKDDIAKMIPAAKAHLYLRTKDYKQALEALEEAIEKEGDRNKKARYAFIRAQIYESMNSNPLAYEEYRKAKKFSTKYELDFNAGLNELKLGYREGSISKDKALNKLDNMLADRKNELYGDQIHFTIAQILLDYGDVNGAIAEFESAIGASGGNQNVKLEAYLRLADLLFEKGLYSESKTNYDEVLSLMKKTDDRYKSVERLSKNLTDIALNIETIKLQDSLLVLSKKPESELREIAKEILRKNAELAQKDDSKDSKDPRQSSVISSNRQLGGGRSNFFAYNPIALNQGKVEFVRTWGERVWEDNWRRSLRSDAGLTAEDIVGDVIVEEEEISEEDIRELLRDVPRNPSQVSSSEKRIQNALFQLGILFRERLRNYPKSIEVLSRLTSEFPDFERRDEALFYLYLSYLEMEEDSKANSVLAEMRRGYPESKYTKLATDPSYAKSLRENGNSIENYYDQTYDLFEQGQYQMVLDNISEKEKLFPKSTKYNAKFDLLKAMSLGNINGKPDYVEALQQVIRSYPKTPEETRAKEILRFLKGDAEAFNEIIFDEALDVFEVAPEKLHYIFVVTYGMDQKTFDDTKVEILNYNKKFHRFDNLKISNIYLNQENQARIILVRSFDNQEKSMKYYEGVQKNKDLFIKDPNVGYDIFAVTQQNYREVIKQKGITNYRAYFELNYLNK